MDPQPFPTARRRRPWRLVFVTLLGLTAVGAVAAAVLVLMLLPSLPQVQHLAEADLKVPLRVYTADGELLAEFGEERRIMVQIDEVPPRLIQAIISAEDHNFYRHYGVDVLGIVRAAWHNLRAGGNVQGASTITMQVARNFFLSPEKTYTRKLKELLLALKIERELTKGQILELYINKIFLGHRAYGFAAAAQVYYGAPLDELTLPQLAMLAGLPKAPSRDNPLTNPDNARERRNYVLEHMYQLGYIDQAEFEQARAAPLTASRHSINYALEAPYVAEMVRQYMVRTYDEKAYAGGFHVYTTIRAEHQRAANRALRAALLAYDRRHGYRGPAAHVQLEEPVALERLDDVLKDYRVVGELVPAVVTQVGERAATVYTLDGTTVELGWEALSWARPYIDENRVGDEPSTAAQVVRRGDIVYLEPLGQTDGVMGWRLAQIPQVSGALVSLRPRDGAILALVGGFDFYQSSFNRVIQAERQPGSGLKPFIYTAALAKGFTPATTISGAPIVIEDANLEDEWRPQNYSERFFGPTRLRKALALSLNLVSVRLLRAIGPAYAADYLTRFGFEPGKLPRNLSLALGNAAATPLQMARAFSVFANGGFRVEPYFIERIEDATHTVLEQAEPLIACPECAAPAADPGATARAAGAGAPGAGSADAGNADSGPRVAPRVLSPELAFIMTTMLQDVVREGTARRAMALRRHDLAGKTGTTDEYRDAWFNGFNSEIAATAWVGFDQLASLGRGEAGSRAALPMWIDYMRTALAGVPEKTLEPPPGVVRAYVDSETGTPLPGPGPNAIEEWFVAGTEGITPIPPQATGEEGAGVQAPAAAAPAAPEPVRPPPTQKVRERLF